MTCEVWISFLMWSFNVGYRELVRWEIIYPLSTIGVETWSQCFFFASHEAHSQGEGNCQSLLGTQSLQASWLVAFILWTRACCIHPVNIETHFKIGASYWSLHRYSKRIFRIFLHDFHMICRFTGVAGAMAICCWMRLFRWKSTPVWKRMRPGANFWSRRFQRLLKWMLGPSNNRSLTSAKLLHTTMFRLLKNDRWYKQSLGGERSCGWSWRCQCGVSSSNWSKRAIHWLHLWSGCLWKWSGRGQAT